MQSYTNIPDSFLQFDLQAFIDRYAGQDVNQLALRLSGHYPFPFALLAEQLNNYQKAHHKLPFFTKAYCFLTSKSFEQASSEALARFKASLFSGRTCLDLSGGLGVDDWAFAQQFEHVVSLDKDAGLNKLVRKNFEKLGVHNVERVDADAMKYAHDLSQHVDLIYLDADRRPESAHKRVAALADAEPDILQLKDQLFRFSPKVLLKLSPMLDIDAVIHELKDVSAVYVAALDNEVKELLVLLQPQASQPLIHAVNISGETVEQFAQPWGEKPVAHYHDEGRYFYEPALCLIKAGLAAAYAGTQHVQLLAPNSNYGVSDQLATGFMGRSFQVVNRLEFSKSALKRYLAEQGITQANMAKRNFPAEAEALKKQFGIKDGGAEYLFFTRNAAGEKLVFHCRKLA